MSGNGPVVTGIDPVVHIVIGAAYTLFARAVVTDATSPSITATVQLSTASDGVLSDPNAAADGGVYDPVTGVYTVSGTAAQVSAALQGLLFTPSSSVSSGNYDFLLVSLTDGNNTTYQTGVVAVMLAGTSFIVDAQQIDLSGSLVAVTSGGNQTLQSVQGNNTGGTIAALDDADVAMGYGVVYLSGAPSEVEFDAAPGDPWDAAYGDDGLFALFGASLSVYGNGAAVTFSPTQAADAVSFYGREGGGYADTVVGSNGTVIDNGVAVKLSGDNDTVDFYADDDILTLSAATAGAWSVLYAQSGTVNLAGASLSVIGGGVTVNAQGGDDAASFYQTNGVADVFNGDGGTITLNQAQVVVNGASDAIWFEGGSGSTVTVNPGAGQVDTVYGAGTILLASGGVVSVGGGALIDFQQAGGVAYLSYTQGIWDRVEGAAGTTNIYNAQVVVSGGSQIVNFTNTSVGDDDMATLIDTNSDWDSVYGYGETLTVDGAQANIYGSFTNIYLQGVGTALSLYGLSYRQETIWGSGATVVAAQGSNPVINGGNNTIFGVSAGYQVISLSGTNGHWDTVYTGQSYVELDDAQTSLFGGYDNVYLYGSGESAVSIYQTEQDLDAIYGTGYVTLNDAQVVSYTGEGDTQQFFFGGSANTVSIGSSASDDVFTFVGSFGVDSITGFASTDKVQLSSAQFANFGAAQAAMTMSGDDTVLTLDANDKVTFVGVAASSLTAAQFSFV